MIRVQFYHSAMGLRNFSLNEKENLAEIRQNLYENSPMTIFENYRFEHNEEQLNEFEEIGKLVNNEARINLILVPFTEKSSLYHFGRVKEILADPIEWLMLSNNNALEEKEEDEHANQP